MSTEITITVEKKEPISWLKANEAYAIMDATLTEEAQKYAIEINDKIKEAAFKGKSNIRIDTTAIDNKIIKKIVAHLEELGYEISHYSSYFFDIYWAS
jgi:hypothetical protein